MSSPSLTQSTSTLLNDHVNQWAGVSDGPFVITLTAGSIIVTVRFHEGGQTDADSPAAGQAEFLMGISFSRNDGTSEQIQSATVIEPSTTLPQSGCRQEPCHGHLLRPPPPRFFHTPPPPTGGVLPATRQTTTKLRCWRMRPGVSDRPVCGRRNSTADPRRVLHRCKRRKTKSISAGPDMVIADSAVTEVSAPNNAVSTDKAKAGAAAFDRIVTNECFEIDADEVLAVMNARKTVETITPAKTTDVLSGKKYVRSSSILSFSIGDAAPAMKRSADESTTDEHEVETHTSSI